MGEGTEFLLALAAKPQLMAVELQLLIRTAVAQWADTELDQKQHNLFSILNVFILTHK